MLNEVVLVGKLSNDPQTFMGNKGKITKFNLAIEQTLRGQHKRTNFPQIIAFGKHADVCMKYLKKGRVIVVKGHLQTGRFETKDGVTVYTTDVVMEHLTFMPDVDLDAFGKGFKELKDFDSSYGIEEMPDEMLY